VTARRTLCKARGWDRFRYSSFQTGSDGVRIAPHDSSKCPSNDSPNVKLWSYQGAVLGACTLAFFATMAARLAISPVVPAISDAFAVSNGALGLALTGMWMAYAAAQFPSGLLADRYGERRIILVAVGGTAVASGLLALAPTYPVFLVAAVVLGGVAGLHFSVATSLLTRLLPNTGSAIGLHTAGAPVAGVLIPMAAGSVGLWLGWRWAVALGVAVAVPAALLFGSIVRPIAPVRPDEPVWNRLRVGPLLELLARPPIAWTLGLSVAGAFVWQATASFLPAFLIEHHGYSEPLAGLLFSVYFAVQGLVQPALGSLSDRVDRYPAAALVLGIGVAGYTVLVVGSGEWMVGAGVVAAGVAMCWGAALLPKFMDHLDAEERSAGFGLIRSAYMVLGATGSVVTGAAADLLGWEAAFLGLAVLQGAMLLVLLSIMWTARRDRPEPVVS
jgi:MFS family permease